MAFGAVYGPPFVREGEVRRDATMDDFRNFTRLAQSFPVLDSAGGVICEPNDTPLDSRHLDMTYALQTLTDKVYMGNVVSGVNAADTLAMTSILFGSREAIEETPATISLINCNSPLRWDDRMLESQFEYSAAGQPVVLTPFILMGAMSPVTIPAALVQQIAEALSGIALSQLIRPGTPVIFGSFLSNIDMQSGSPTFGTPESGHRACSAPARSRGTSGCRSAPAVGSRPRRSPTRRPGYEALMTMLPTFLAGANWVMHSAGWLEGGLVAGYEKFIVDIELLQMLQREFTPLEIDEDSMAFGAHEEVGHGGHFLGATHTMERFRTCFYRPLLSSSENYERWMRNGGKDAAVRAGEIYKKRLEEYEPPPLDDAIRAGARGVRRPPAGRARRLSHAAAQGSREAEDRPVVGQVDAGTRTGRWAARASSSCRRTPRRRSPRPRTAGPRARAARAPSGAPSDVGIRREGVLRLRHADRQRAVPVPLDAQQPPPGLGVPGHQTRAVEPGRDRLDLRGEGEVVVVGERERVRRRLVQCLQHTLRQVLCAHAAVGEVGRREGPHALGRHQLDHLRHLRVGVGREAVHRNDAGDAVHVADVVEVAGAGSPCPASTAPTSSMPRSASAHAAVVLQRPHRRHDHRDVGTQPGLAALDVDELLRAEVGARSRPR